MPFTFRLLEEAYKEYIEAFQWYELKQTGLGEKFKNNVEKKLLQISEHPQFYSRRNHSYREAKIENFPFAIIYKFFSRKKFIEIIAIYHEKRNPKKKYRKMK